MGQIFFKFLVGAAMGLLAWVIWERQFPVELLDPTWESVELKFVLTLGALIGGLSDSFMGSSKAARFIRFAAWRSVSDWVSWEVTSDTGSAARSSGFSRTTSLLATTQWPTESPPEYSLSRRWVYFLVPRSA